MKIRRLLIAGLLFMAFAHISYSQEFNCDVRQIKLQAYEFVLKNLDSVKKKSPQELIMVAADVSENGVLQKITYRTKDKKEAKVWKGLSDFIATLFGFCPSSHFYDDTAQVDNDTFTIPLVKETLEKAIAQIKAEPGYRVPGSGFIDIPRNAKYVLDLKKLIVSKNGLAPMQLTGTMDVYTSGKVKLSPEYYLVFRVDKKSDSKTTYLSYKIIEVINYKATVVTKESWRPLINGKVHLSVTGHRDTEGDVNPEKDLFEIEADIAFE
jgi:hypothetical protein